MAPSVICEIPSIRSAAVVPEISMLVLWDAHTSINQQLTRLGKGLFCEIPSTRSVVIVPEIRILVLGTGTKEVRGTKLNVYF